MPLSVSRSISTSAGGNQEHVEAGLADDRLALFAGPHLQRLDDFDPERFDDGFHVFLSVKNRDIASAEPGG